MRRALELARMQNPHPNPRVGALVVSSSGEVIGEGSHSGPGEPHAEVVALGLAGVDAGGSTLYVTLEPCAHRGRTPPCVDAVIEAGIERVVFAVTDPDSRVAGKGAARLSAAGIEVIEDFSPAAARETDPAYFHHRETGMPLVTLKYAMTLDGSVAARDRTSRWITSEVAQQDAHELRSQADAVVVGVGTLRADDPLLDVRIPGYEGSQPRPVIVSGANSLPATSRIWKRDPLVVSSLERELPAGELVLVQGDGNGRPEPQAACAALAAAGYLDILFEGGPRLAGAWWKAGVVARGVVYLGAKLGGGMGIPPLDDVFETLDEAATARITGVHTLGPDVRIDFERPL